jgi:hypothetical protein
VHGQRRLGCLEGCSLAEDRPFGLILDGALVHARADRETTSIVLLA